MTASVPGPFVPAHQMLQALEQRDLSAVELLELHLARIERLNPALNAVVTLDVEQARRTARQADEARAQGVTLPLLGLPFTVKDVLETAGLRTTAGFLPLSDHLPAIDAPAVARLKAAGGVLIGKTNTPTLAMGAEPDNPIFGRTNNPWDARHSPGGSSGGEAAAVAAGLSPLGLGSDAGGSVRIPAHFCGIFALKPTEHRIPTTGHIPELPGMPRGLRHLATLGPLARSVDDLALALSVLAGPDGRQWEVPPVPIEPLPDVDRRQIRLTWSEDLGLPTDEATTTAIADVAARLSKQMMVRHEGPLTWSVTEANEVGMALFNAEVPRSAQPQSGEREVTMREYISLLDRRDRLIAQLETFFADVDVLMCPVVGTPAWTHRTPGTPVVMDGEEYPYWSTALAHCMPFNLTGHPVVVVPVTLTAQGLPIGVQLVGRRWGEARLLAVARHVAEVAGPVGSPPAFS
ncbi:amidase [Deinococcus malanensis]|uniref:Amidase n=1 Tax=Deinococcus malanensis TaxID=1706855 RepID=A0ABQ2F3D8_9DEIO|nr:amidase family protein [Deinococcus malanensis]GGK36825.1 amidase [Deinococcus malanensis]